MINKLKYKIRSDFHLKEMINGASSNFIIQIFGILLGYLVVFLISHFYGAKGLGIFTLTFAVVNIFVLVGKAGFDTSIVKFISENIDSKQISIKEIYLLIMKLSIPVNFILILIMIVFSPYIAHYIFNDKNLTPYFQVMSLVILPISLRSINANALRGLKKIKIYSLLQNVFIHLFFIIGILIVNIFTNTIEYLILSYVFSAWLVFIISSTSWYKNMKKYTTAGRTKNSIKNILKVSIPMLLTSSLMLVITWTDSIMLGIFCSEIEVGLYSIAMKIATSSLIILMAFSSILAPKIAQAYGNSDLTLLRSLIQKTNKLIIAISLPVIVILIIITPYLLSFFGEEFKVAYSAFSILMVGMTWKVVFGVSEYILQMTNKQRDVAKYSVIGIIINIFLNIYLIPKFGINGAAMASVISIICMQILFFKKVKNDFGISSVFKKRCVDYV